MGEVIAEIIGTVFIRFLLNYPGALIRWILFRKKPFMEYVKEDTGKNVWVTLLIIGLLITYFLLR